MQTYVLRYVSIVAHASRSNSALWRCLLLYFFFACIAMASTSESPLDGVPSIPMDEAESPLLGHEAPDWLESARQQLQLDDMQEVKHRFVHMRLAADWLAAYPLDIDVNKALQISCGNGNWHGNAAYYTDDPSGLGIWSLTFHHRADTSKMRTTRYRQVRGTGTYLSVESTSSNQFNSMLIVKKVNV